MVSGMKIYIYNSYIEKPFGKSYIKTISLLNIECIYTHVTQIKLYPNRYLKIYCDLLYTL